MLSVCLRAAFTLVMLAKWPRIESISLSIMVARLSVITTESSRNRAALPSGEDAAINTRLGWPTAGQVTGNHRNDRLFKTAVEIIALKNQRRAALCGAQV
jgi:hypothetical protein